MSDALDLRAYKMAVLDFDAWLEVNAHHQDEGVRDFVNYAREELHETLKDHDIDIDLILEQD